MQLFKGRIPIVTISLLLAGIVIAASFIPRNTPNDKLSYFALLGTLGLALLISTHRLSGKTSTLIIILAGIPLMAAASFYSVPSVGYGTQTLAFARNSIFVTALVTALCAYGLRRAPAWAAWPRYAIVAQLCLFSFLLIARLGGTGDVLESRGEQRLQYWRVPVDVEGTRFLGALEGTAYLLSPRNLIEIDLASKRITRKIPIPLLAAENLGYTSYQTVQSFQSMSSVYNTTLDEGQIKCVVPVHVRDKWNGVTIYAMLCFDFKSGTLNHYQPHDSIFPLVSPEWQSKWFRIQSASLILWVLMLML